MYWYILHPSDCELSAHQRRGHDFFLLQRCLGAAIGTRTPGAAAVQPIPLQRGYTPPTQTHAGPQQQVETIKCTVLTVLYGHVPTQRGGC